MNWDGRIKADARALPIASSCVQCVVTSPPYWGLRDYGSSEQIGLESTPAAYVDAIREVFVEVARVLRDDGTVWLNLGDSYAGSWGAQSRENPGNQSTSRLQGGSPLSARQILAHPKQTHTGSLKNTPGLKAKDLVGIPWRVAFALQADGWYLRSDIIWAKPNPMPESVTDRPTRAHEYIFLLSKSERYFYDAAAISEPAINAGDTRHLRSDNTQAEREKQAGHGRRHDGFNSRYFTGNPQAATRNKRSVWTVTTRPYPEAHYATFPPELIEPCILAGSKPGDFVMDPFAGSGTTARVCEQFGRRWISCDLAYQDLQGKRLENVQKVLI